MLMVIFIGLVMCFGLVVLVGAPYLRTLKANRAEMLELAGISRGVKVADYGSGDGQLVLEAAGKGANAVGYELNPVLAMIGWARMRAQPLAHQSWGNFWRVNSKQFDVIFVFLHPRFMQRLDEKLISDGFRGSVVSFAFEIPGRDPAAQKGSVLLYSY